MSIVTVAVALVAAALPSLAAPAPPASCAIERLAEPPDSRLSIVTGADPTGRFLLGRGYPHSGSLERSTVIWDDGVIKRVAVPGIDQLLHDVNSSGVVVGASYDPLTWQLLTPWLYRGGVLSPLPGVEQGEALAVNERGDIAGNRSGAQPGPIWWPAGRTGAGPVPLPVPKGTVFAEARDIDEDGTIVGTYMDDDFQDHAYVWRPDGTGRELRLPAGITGTSRGYSIRDGWVSGVAVTAGFGFVPVRWHLPSGQAQLFPRFQSIGAVNAHGWLAGMDSLGKALFLAGERALPLRGLTAHEDPTGDYATALSDDGRRIGGQAVDSLGNIRAVRWTCH